MATARLTASRRSQVGKGVARTLRRSGKTPGIIYGHAREPQPLALDSHELLRLLDQIAAGSTVVELELDGSTSRTLIREVQRHPFKREILHIDFQELVAGEKVTVSVPIVLVGAPEGVKAGGIMDQTMRELEIEVDPSNMPGHVELDVTALTIGHSLHVSDLKLPEGVTVLVDEDATVCVVVPPKAVEEPVAPVAAEEEVVAEPELIRKPKGEEEEEGGGGEGE